MRHVAVVAVVAVGSVVSTAGAQAACAWATSSFPRTTAAGSSSCRAARPASSLPTSAPLTVSSLHRHGFHWRGRLQGALERIACKATGGFSRYVNAEEVDRLGDVDAVLSMGSGEALKRCNPFFCAAAPSAPSARPARIPAFASSRAASSSRATRSSRLRAPTRPSPAAPVGRPLQGALPVLPGRRRAELAQVRWPPGATPASTTSGAKRTRRTTRSVAPCRTRAAPCTTAASVSSRRWAAPHTAWVAHVVNTGYAPIAVFLCYRLSVQHHPNGDQLSSTQFEFARPSARTPHVGYQYV